jgi:hypothetical protein
MTAKTIYLDPRSNTMLFGATEIGPLTEIPAKGPTRSRAETVLRWIWWAGIACLVMIVAFMAWLVATSGLYKSGDDVGYNLGLVGGLLMLSLLLYPLRKRVRFMSRIGSMKAWFRFHMIAGISGPLLVLFHSTFQIGSMNGRVALYAMILVASSGLVGRFLYRHIHKGMYGQHLSLRDAEEDLRKSSEDVRTVFSAYPEIEERLRAFREEAFASGRGLGVRLWRFMTLRFRGHRLSGSVRTQLIEAMRVAKKEQRLSRTQRILTYRLAKEKADAYVDAVCEASQLSSWEKLFSLWHVVHVPFLYLLMVSGIVHVVAVHMY